MGSRQAGFGSAATRSTTLTNGVCPRSPSSDHTDLPAHPQTPRAHPHPRPCAHTSPRLERSPTEAAAWLRPRFALRCLREVAHLRGQRWPLRQSSPSLSLPVPRPCFRFPYDTQTLLDLCIFIVLFHQFHPWNIHSKKKGTLFFVHCSISSS